MDAMPGSRSSSELPASSVHLAALVVLFRRAVELDRGAGEVLALLHQLVQGLTTLEEVVHGLHHGAFDLLQVLLDLRDLSASEGSWYFWKSASTGGHSREVSALTSSHLPVIDSMKMRTDSESSEKATLMGYSASTSTAAARPWGCTQVWHFPRFCSMSTVCLLPRGVRLTTRRLWNLMCSLIAPLWKKLKADNSWLTASSTALSSFHL
eukprot:CAMPEP_0175278710 /NCGR_PEP_ID=MMETSP0093-20121207/49663_2 /TAXON_ID=311494 /ORGANISM="Alexandrium monilatum, Strain CCMP3105" /LENGTH=208 /DNA_ID=CAMNT_0016573703 /DNA_START=29 /DNA_END=656 /DNA_ORIENTATION=-